MFRVRGPWMSFSVHKILQQLKLFTHRGISQLQYFTNRSIVAVLATSIPYNSLFKENGPKFGLEI
jgi:hypothetical protein